MRAIKQVRQIIERDPHDPSAVALSQLVLALEGEGRFDVKELYALDYDRFQLALRLLADWRLDGHFSAKFRLMDISVAAQALESGTTGQPASPQA